MDRQPIFLLMKYQIFASALLLSALGTTSQGAVSSQIGDLILAFREKDNSVAFNLEVDLGPVINLLSLPAGTVVNLNLGGAFFGTTRGLSAQDLRNVYGEGGTDNTAWNGDPTLAFNLFATPGAAGGNTLFLSAPTGSILPRSSSGGQQGTAGRINTVSGTLNGSTALISPQSASLDSTLGGSYSFQYKGGNPGTLTKDWNQFTVVTETNVTSAGAAITSLYRLDAGSGAGQEIGQFSLASDGTLTYLSVVPEPVTNGLLTLGAAILLGGRWRRESTAKQGSIAT